MTITQALILVGGKGTRLGELTKETPKPMLEIAGKPFLEYLVRKLIKSGINEVILSSGYLGERISAHFGDGTDYGIHIRTVIEPEPLGTGGAVLFARRFLGKQFLILNGDTFFDVDYSVLEKTLDGSQCDAGMALRQVDNVGRYGTVELDGRHITKFTEKKSLRGRGYVNGGVYVLDYKVLDSFPEGYFSMERDLFPRLASKRRLCGVPLTGYFVDIGVPESFHLAKNNLTNYV